MTNGLVKGILITGLVSTLIVISCGDESKQRNGFRKPSRDRSKQFQREKLSHFQKVVDWQGTLHSLTSASPKQSSNNNVKISITTNSDNRDSKKTDAPSKFNENSLHSKKNGLKKFKRNAIKGQESISSDKRALSSDKKLQQKSAYHGTASDSVENNGVATGSAKYLSKRQRIMSANRLAPIHKYYSNGAEHRYLGGAIHRFLSKPVDIEALTGNRLRQPHNFNTMGHTKHFKGGRPRIGSVKSIPFIGSAHVDAIGDGARIVPIEPKLSGPIVQNVGAQTHIAGLEGLAGPVHIEGGKNMVGLGGFAELPRVENIAGFGPGAHFDKMDGYAENRFEPPKLMGSRIGGGPMIHMMYPGPPPPPLRPHNHLMIINRPVHHTLRIPVPVPVQGPSKIIVVNRPVPMPPKSVPIPVVVPGPPLPPRLLVVHHHHMMNGPCEEKPCRNGGSCSASDSGFKCVCALGYKGDRCEVQSQCIPNPCKNFGKCTELVNDYECTCHSGFHGKNCDIESKCEPSPCRNGGFCTETRESYICSCKQGFMGKNCEQESKCHPVNPCQNNGVCKEDLSGYKCLCPDAYGGINCEVHTSTNGCDSSPCLNGATCIADTSDASRYVCNCSPGFSGHTCQATGCSNCPSDAQCIDGNCMYGNNQLQVPSQMCEPINPCMYGGTCIPSGFSFNCICPDGRGGVHCEVSLSSICDQCSRHAYCKDDKCLCKAGYTGNGFHCRRKKTRCHPNPCENGGTCHEQSHMYTSEMEWYCECMKGYSGKTCTEYDPCTEFTCHNGGTCQTINKQPQCACLPPFEGPTCELENLCLPSGGRARNPCLNGGTCQSVNGKINCLCPVDYEGNNCEQNKCNRCAPHASCLKGLCVCRPGYIGNGIICEEPTSRSPTTPTSPDHCKPDPCTNGASCIDGKTTFFCVCTGDYFGRTCSERRQLKIIYKEKINEYEYSLCHPNPCLHGGICKEVSTKDFECICANPRFKGRYCDVDMCSECDVHARCVHGKCICREGYEGDGYTCTREKTTCGSCPVYATCESDVCVCRPGYTWSHQQQCPQGGTCADQPSSKRSCIPNSSLTRRLKAIENYAAVDATEQHSPTSRSSNYWRPFNSPIAQPLRSVQDEFEHARQLSQSTPAQTPTPKSLQKANVTMKLPAEKTQEWSEDIIVTEYQSLGCWADTPNWRNPNTRALISLEGMDSRVTGDYRKRKQPISKCAEIARGLGYKIFAIQNGGQCFSGPWTRDYKTYGASENCKNGVGGSLANDVYKL